jgi:DNA-binding NarL/FixJ family response regulator
MQATPGTKIKILIVDDLQHVRSSLRTILALADDLKVIGEAGNGLEAIHLVNELKPDIVLMDVEMPQLDGLSATQRIKQQHPDVGVVILTILSDTAVREQAAKVGANAFITKGTDIDILMEIIRETQRAN